MEQSAPPRRRVNTALRALMFALVICVLLGVGAIVAFRDAAARIVLRSAAHGLGYDLTAGGLDVGPTKALLTDARVERNGEPVLSARRIEVHYALRDLLPGGKRLFGLESVDVRSPRVTLIHHPDGTYNVSIPSSVQPARQSSGPPLDVAFHIADGSIEIVDRFVAAPRERRERFVEVAADGAISPSTPSAYRAGAVLVADGKRYPIRGRGRFGDDRGFELQRWTAVRLPIAFLADFALSTHALVVQAGTLDRLDLTVGALRARTGVLETHVGVSGALSGVRVAAASLAKPLRDAHGTFVVGDDVLTVRTLDAAINGFPLHVRGVLYDFAAPRIAFALTGRGEIAQLRAVSRDVAKIPISGAIGVDVLAEGAAASPVLFARIGAPDVRYGAFRLAGARGFAAVSGQELDLLSASVRYGRVAVAGRGALLLARHTQTAAYARLAAPANALPYANNLLPGVPFAATVAARGVDARIGIRGYLGGHTGGDSLDVPFSIAADGSGTVGPLTLLRHDGASLYARARLDPAAHQTVAIVDARHMSLLAAPAVTLPGLALPPVPAGIDGKLDAHLVARARGSALSDASGAVHAYGGWGDLRATAGGSGTRVAASGRFTSSFERLAAYTGQTGATGGIDAPFAVVNSGGATIVQVAGARFAGATLRGVALQAADATLGVGKRAIDIYSANVRIADRNVTASGSFGNGGHVHLTAGDLDFRALRQAGVAAADGRASVIADVGGTFAKPTATLLAALGGAHFAGTAIGGDIGVVYDGAALRIDRATLTYGGAYADAVGTVGGLALGHIAPRYDLRAQLQDADIATLARTVKTPLRYPEGTLDAVVRVGGGGAHPNVAGALRLPEGSLNGLNFRDGQVAFAGDAAAVRASGGRVTVGSTTLDFGGSASRTQQSATLRSGRIDLSDFDDYFDEAEVLAGTGSAAIAFDAAPSRLNTAGHVALAGVRYRRFTLGRVDASASTVGSAIRIDGNVAGPNGRASLDGDVRVASAEPLRDIARRSYVDLRGQISGINLGTVLPAAGITAPVLGVVNGSAAVHGRYPGLALSVRAALTGGVVGRLPIERLTLAATAANGHGRLTDAELAAPGIAANVSGRFGLRPSDAFDLQAFVVSPNINTLAAAATGKSPGVTGALQTRARLTGTIAKPVLNATLDASDITYAGITIPRLHTDLDATRAAVDVRNGLVALPRNGTIAFDGHAPLSAGPHTPIAFAFAPHAVNVNPYSSLLPDGSVLQGIFDGSVGVRGTLAAPQLAGRLTFANGSYRSNTVKLPLTGIALQLDFAGTTVRIAKLHARALPGNFDGSGSVTFRDLRDPLRGTSATVNVKASNALVSAPKYYVGYIDGTLAINKRSGATPVVGGDLTFSSARIPYTALVGSGGSTAAAAPSGPGVNFDLGVHVGRDVRVQSGPVDIGTSGAARLGGTLATPTLDGQFNATDGTVAVYRTFTIQNGSAVTFNPSDGVTPSVDATAITHVADPATDVLLRVTGLSTHLNLAFTSEPAYTQQQILGLLVNAQALGAVSGVAQSGGTSTGGASISGIGAGIVNDQLTKAFLQPLTSKLGGSLGLSDLNVSYNTNGAVSAIARRTIGKNVSFTYGEQIGGPTPRTSLGINIGSSIAGAQLTFYQAAGSAQAFGGQALTPFLQSGFLATSPPNYTLEAIAPPTGSGFVFSYAHHFWARSR